MRESKSYEIAAKIMTELLSNRGFQRIWQETTVDLASHRERQPSRALDDDIGDSAPPLDSVTAAQVVEELSSNINLTVENFMRSLPLALPHSEDRLNRETANLYSVRVQLDRLLNNNHLQLPQLRLASRRITNLLKNFTICTSAHFPVSSCSFLASSLCDLLYRFEELCSLNDDLVPSAATVRLKQCADDFHYDVVKRLNAILLQRRPMTATTTTSGLGTSCRSFSNLNTPSPKPVRLAPTIVWTSTPSKSPAQKSFLISPDLEAARYRIRRSRSILSSNPNNRRAAIDDIERRWRDILIDDPEEIFKTVARREGAESQAALKAACKLTRNVVDEIARHVEKL